MEYIRRALAVSENLTFFLWCFTVPVISFVMTLALGALLSDSVSQPAFTSRALGEFTGYYDRYFLREFTIIFLNNYLAALVVVFFTPIALWIRKLWERWRGNSTPLSPVERTLLFLFPALFLIRQSVNIGIILSGLAGDMSKNIVIAFTGLILPHGLPELAAFSMAGALGMAVTRELIKARPSERLIKGRILALLTAAIAFCAFLEVFLTPKVFALLVWATNNT